MGGGYIGWYVYGVVLCGVYIDTDECLYDCIYRYITLTNTLTHTHRHSHNIYIYIHSPPIYTH